MTIVEAEPQRATGARASELVRELLVDQLPVVREIARGLCRSAAEVEDLVQDVFERALRSIETVDIDKNPRAWMVTLLRNLHIDRCRETARRVPHISCDDVPILAPEPALVPAWYEITADDVRRAATRLPDELRTAYVMFAFEGRSYMEVAAALDIPKATVGTRVLRARAQLKRILTS